MKNNEKLRELAMSFKPSQKDIAVYEQQKKEVEDFEKRLQNQEEHLKAEASRLEQKKQNTLQSQLELQKFMQSEEAGLEGERQKLAEQWLSVHKLEEDKRQ